MFARSTRSVLSPFWLSVTGLLMLGFLGACSAKVSSDGPAPAPNKPPVTVDQVGSINLDGVWASDCTTDIFGRGTQKIVLTIKDHSFSRATTHFSDWNCKNSDGDTTLGGSFSFQKLKDNGVYELEYLVTSGGRYRMPGNIKRDGEKLWISLLANETAVPDTELTLVKP